MTKKFMVILLLSVFLLTSITVTAKDTNGNDGLYRKGPDVTSAKLFGTADDAYTPATGLKLYSPPPNYFPVGNWRQVYETETTQHDRQHYSTSGRQIVYAGYYNAGCDYVYMNYSWRAQLGSSILLNVHVVLFDWGNSDWNFDVGIQSAGPSGSFQSLPYTFAPNMDVIPGTAQGVAGMSIRNDGQPWKSYVAYASAAGCPSPGYQGNVASALPGPPNLQGITTGKCDENLGDETISPYLWPIIDVDTTGDVVITHAVNQEWGFCAAADNDLDAASLVYHRKISTDPNNPSSGTWDGPNFIDSVYNIAYEVRADKRPGHHEVYLVYLKPVYYKYDGLGGHPCGYASNGLYQLTNDVVYKMSSDDGDSWGATTYITDYITGFEDGKTEPAVYDISTMIDPDGTLHVVWISPNHDEACSWLYASKMWHWDNSNNCISVAYDASHPATLPSTANINAWNWTIAKPSLSYCDNSMYIVFVRYGAHTDPEDDDAMGDIAASTFVNTDLLLVASDDVDGGLGQVWTNAVNITNTETDDCAQGDCESEHWPTMAMYSSDSLMIEYILDLEAGTMAGPNDPNDAELHWTDNPVIFMTWPCFAMSALPQNICVSTTPSSGIYKEVALAPNGNPSGCTTEGTYTTDIVIANCGNVNLSYTASSNAAWLTINSGNSGSIDAGTGPNNADNWSGAPGCASPALINWTANSATLGVGNYTGAISVNVDNPGIDDFDITVNLVVACDYYLPEYASVTGGCWTIDLWNTPQAANQQDNSDGNMKFYACGDTISPLYHEALMVGWKVGSDIFCYSDAITTDSSDYFLRALTNVTLDSVGTPSSGVGYFFTEGYWSTPDSLVKGKIQYFVPGHQDTSVLIEKVTLWNESGTTLNDFIVGEESDWDCDRDSSLDAGGIDVARNLVYQQGDHNDQSVVAGLSPYAGQDGNFAAMAVNGYDYAYYTLGWYPDTMYNVMSGLSGLSVFSDSTNGTEMRVINRFIKGSLGATDTIEICKVKAVSLTGVEGLQQLIDKGMTYIEDNELCAAPPECQGRCGNANGDASVNVSDAVYVINFVFVGGNAPLPVKACGNANGDTSVNVSDAVYIINFVFVGGTAPGDCHPGVWGSDGGDCCPY